MILKDTRQSLFTQMQEFKENSHKTYTNKKDKQKQSLKTQAENLLTTQQAALWASEYLGKKVSNSNISYLINYGKIANHSKNLKESLIDIEELKNYYDSLSKNNDSLSHPLSFSKYKEAETTKHIHRLHPYKGKFIPQLVEYFLDSHIDELKQESFFKKGDIVLDIFCGSGTSLCVANELGMHAIGLELSIFNTKLANAKVQDYDIKTLESELQRLSKLLESYNVTQGIKAFENVLNQALSKFNAKYFPRDFKRKVALKELDEKSYGKQKELEFLPIYQNLLKEFRIDTSLNTEGSFFEKWYVDSIKQEIMLLKNAIDTAPKDLQEILQIILSRTARSCRATTHSDLATLQEPVTMSYYCKKHGRICKPLFSIQKWFKSYAKDTLKRLQEFKNLKTSTKQICLNADSKNANIMDLLKKQDSDFATLLKSQKIAGIFSSPPYVGLIDYHEQHAYSYDIFGLKRQDSSEIGRLSEGQSKAAQEQYVKDIAQSLKNAKAFLQKDYVIFLVANDKFSLYPKIADLAGMKIIKKYDRPVLNRSERDSKTYSESIFCLKDKNA